ncbi:E3 ubiquitin-protein ligase TRIM35-like [Anoplopoma fimbria]|uniref:E3 ubiquitin-protein ligase TRIM35-like n=1 Tax=Anoplopoma fimbria TaxID=229290 RepID=UPI0023EA9B7D|nr:E3 ubiquitin-protein ligase TRIM35-like [Anoplopoma fimbria]
MTASVNIHKLLKDHLDELDKEELREFQWYLAMDKGEGSRPILRSKLERATREKTVDKLVQFYGGKGALATTVEILFMMNQNNLAQKLIQAKIGPNVEQKLSDAGRTHRDGDLKKVIHTEPEPQSPAGPSGGHRKVSESFRTPCRTIREKSEAFKKVKQFCDESVEHFKRQRRNTEQKIKDDFEKLQLFLKTEEAARIAALEEEETQKICMMQKITELSSDTFSLSDTLKDMEDLGADDSFIQNFRTEMERTQNTLPDPKRLPQALINVSKHVENLQFRVLEKMLSTVKHTPVVLDPNTASPWLSLSEDLTTVSVTDTWRQQPGYNTSYPQVLGHEGFDSGKHCWEAEVGSHTRWILGVAEEAIDRKEEMWSTPGLRLFTIMRRKRRYTDVKGNTLRLPGRPQRIRIELDYEKGEVSFYDADSNTSIKTYEEKFTQKMYPYFGFVEIDDEDDEGVKIKRKKENSSGSSIQICESKVSLTVT